MSIIDKIFKGGILFMKVGRSKSLFTKMLFSIILCILVIFISSGFMIEKRTAEIVTELNYRNLESEAKAAANQVSEFFQGMEFYWNKYIQIKI